MKPVYLTVLILVPYLSCVEAATSSLVLNLANNVAAGQSATYNCTSSGNGVDPTLVWFIRRTDGTYIRNNSQLTSSVVDGASNPNDGTVKSSVTFIVQSSYLTNHRLWCGAIDSGSSATSITIYTTIAATTTTTASLGEACSSQVTCSTANAACSSSNVCVCSSGYYDTNGVSSSGGSCSQQVGLGSTCTAGIDESCLTANARCSFSSPYVCQCGSGYVQSGTICISDSASLGQSCVSPTRTCYISNSNCNGNICVCNNGYYRSGSVCVISPAAFGAACTNPTRTCTTTNAECSGGTCTCQFGYTYSSSAGYCITSSATYGGACTNPTRTCTTANTECRSGTCQCSSGYTYSNTLGYCITESATYGGSCTNPTRVCTTTSTECISGTCQCSSGYTYSSSLGYCITSSATYGGSCTNPTRTCTTTNTECISGTCQCSSGYTYSSSFGYCITGSALNGQSCTNPARTCVTNAACSGGTCQCQSGYYQASSSSCVKPTAGQSCTTSVGCATNSGTTTATATCTNNICVCPSGYYATSGVCYIRASLGNTCNTGASIPCLDSNAACTGSPTTCQCNSGYSNSGGSCVQQSTSSSCPAGSSSPATVTGTTFPSTPSVTVERTCYDIDLTSTQVMACRDSKGASSLLSARWQKLPNYNTVVISTGRFINGDIANPNLTVSNTESGDAGYYVCQLCYGSNYTQCTTSNQVQLIVSGTQITAASASATATTPLRGNSVTFTCTTTPADVATSIRWFLGSTQVSTSSTYTISTIGTSQAGTYTCEAGNSYGTVTSNSVSIDVQYLPEASGGSSITTTGNFDDGDITITCSMNANPAIITYYFYDSSDNQLQSGSSNTYVVTSSLGYQTYSCRAQNSRGLSEKQFLIVEEATDPPNIGAATENTGIGTGTIAAIVLGIIFLLLLIIIIIVCCCSYGWCRKKEKVEPQVIVEKPIAKPYIPSVSTEFEEPRYTTPRYHLKPASNGGPIISMYDDGYEQPRAHQLPALDTQYLYTDTKPRKHKKKRRRRHEDVSPRRQHYEPEPEPDVRYAEAMPASDEDLVVVPGKQNYFE